jgi:phosphoglycerol transferase MdoB-like AlkP superfamily enzyme
MNLSAFLPLVIVPASACVISRLFMFRTLTRADANFRELAGLVFPGAGKDMLFLLVPLAALHGLGVLFHLPAALLTGCQIFIFLGVLVVTLANIADAVIYHYARSRFFSVLIKETRLSNIIRVLSSRQKAALVLFALIMACCFPSCLGPPASPDLRLFGADGLLLALSAVFARNGTGIDAGTYLSASTVGKHEYVAGLTRERLDAIGRSAVVNLALCLFRGWKESGARLRFSEYTETEVRFLEQSGLLHREKYAVSRAPSARPKRIVLIVLESVGSNFIPFYNPHLPKELMPFLETLIRNYPRLDNLYTANAPTDEGLYALHASRLGCEHDIRRRLGRIDSLSSLIREEGYLTCVISGCTRHYGNKEVFFRSLLRYERFLAEEDIRKCIPGAKICNWGADDRSLYAMALKILEDNRDKPVLLTVETCNTHPPFSWLMDERQFPQSIARTRSRLLRSLHQVDRDLLFFFSSMAKKKLFDDDTLLVVTADHTPTHGRECLHYTGKDGFFPGRIPFICVARKSENNPLGTVRRNIQCTQLDLFPTLIDWLGLKRMDDVLGRSLFLGADNAVISKYGRRMRIKNALADTVFDLDNREDGESQIRTFVKWYQNSLLQPLG